MRNLQGGRRIHVTQRKYPIISHVNQENQFLCSQGTLSFGIMRQDSKHKTYQRAAMTPRIQRQFKKCVMCLSIVCVNNVSKLHSQYYPFLCSSDFCSVTDMFDNFAFSVGHSQLKHYIAIFIVTSFFIIQETSANHRTD